MVDVTLANITGIVSAFILPLVAYIFAELRTVAKATQSNAAELAAYKVHVAETYVTAENLREVERRLVAHLLRIEDKLDRREGNDHA